MYTERFLASAAHFLNNPSLFNSSSSRSSTYLSTFIQFGPWSGLRNHCITTRIASCAIAWKRNVLVKYDRRVFCFSLVVVNRERFLFVRYELVNILGCEFSTEISVGNFLPCNLLKPSDLPKNAFGSAC